MRTYGTAAGRRPALVDVAVAPGRARARSRGRSTARLLGRVRICRCPGEHIRPQRRRGPARRRCELGLAGGRAASRGWRGSRGVRRRFELKGVAAGVRVYDDYAHHPTEVAAAAARGPRRWPAAAGWSWPSSRTCYSRTAGLRRGVRARRSGWPTRSWSWTSTAPREDPVPGVTGALVADAVPLPPGQRGVRAVVVGGGTGAGRARPPGRPGAHHGRRRRLHDRARGARGPRSRAGTRAAPASELRPAHRHPGPPVRPAAPRRPAAAAAPLGAAAGDGRAPRVLVRAIVPLLLAPPRRVLWESPLFAVRGIQVDGVTALSAAEVRDAAGLRAGTPLLQVDLDAAAARVRRLPQVAVGAGHPRLAGPRRDHRPRARRRRGGAARRAAHADRRRRGAVRHHHRPRAGRRRARSTVAAPGPGDPATRAALAAIAALPAPSGPQVRQVTAPAPTDVTLTLPSPVAVLWGDGSARGGEGGRARAGCSTRSAPARCPRPRSWTWSAPDAVVLR